MNGVRPAPSSASTNPFQDFLSAPRVSSQRGRSQPREQKLVDVFNDQPPPVNGDRARDGRRRRRNSESSAADRSSRALDPAADEERRRRERRHRERERERDPRRKEGRSRSSRKPQAQLDVIDKLDVTSIYGTGSK